ncbi:MAG: nodulation protein NodH [Pseudomonadota bacterium]
MARFTGFVLFAEMRTGSNALEESINLYDGLTCHGELFNPAFMGHQGQKSLFGLDMAARERDPFALLDAMFGSGGLSGFRFFHDHDARILERILPEPKIAKILLSRDPLEAFVSRKIAETTGQWKLTDARDRKRARIHFDPAEYEEVVAHQDTFRAAVRRALQVSGQVAFEIDHAEINDVEVLNGLARFLGSDTRLDRLRIKLKRQNPEPLSEKVLNPDALQSVGKHRQGTAAPDEPARGANVRTWVAGTSAPLLFMPLKGGPTDRIEAWLSALQGMPAGEGLHRDMSQAAVRKWKNQNKDGRSFTVVSHPVTRAHNVFCRYLLGTAPGAFLSIRDTLRTRYGVPLPEEEPGAAWTASAHHAAFLGFLEFAKANNAGQTSVRTDPAWSSQAALLAGVSQILPPDRIVRDHQSEADLPAWAAALGLPKEDMPAHVPFGPVALAEIYDDAIEDAVRKLHNRDFVAFGYRKWSPRPP